MRVSVASAKVLFLAAVGAALALAPTVGVAWAGSQNFDPVAESSTTINIGTVKMRGQYVFDPSGNAQPYFIQVYANSGECLRLQVDTETTDLEMVVVAPGTAGGVPITWRNDDGGGGCPLCPFIRIDSTPYNGWYTVQVSRFDGDTPSGEFRLRYGRYNSGNPNCAGPTPALFPGQGPEQAKQ